MQLEAIKSEYRKYDQMLAKTMAQINDEQTQKIFGTETNSIAIILNHLAGNIKSRFTNFLTEDGEKSWRHRDSEFEEPNASKDELMKRWKDSLEILNSELDGLSDDDLTRMVKIRGNELSVLEALTRSVSHLSFHVGQIVILARIMLGEKWQTLSIPKGKSEEYNKNPNLERGK